MKPTLQTRSVSVNCGTRQSGTENWFTIEGDSLLNALSPKSRNACRTVLTRPGVVAGDAIPWMVDERHDPMHREKVVRQCSRICVVILFRETWRYRGDEGTHRLPADIVRKAGWRRVVVALAPGAVCFGVPREVDVLETSGRAGPPTERSSQRKVKEWCSGTVHDDRERTESSCWVEDASVSPVNSGRSLTLLAYWCRSSGQFSGTVIRAAD